MKVKKWILYNVILCFAVYWASNLLLWFPWSYSTTPGMIFMLTLAPVLWAYVIWTIFSLGSSETQWTNCTIRPRCTDMDF